MSSLYNLEPQPTAKVVLQTTSGDLTLELFAKQTPLASRNFLQHCLDGYYINTIFHRLVPGFIIQGGDPTGSGSGGISAINDGEPFHDEFHTRLKFNRRGLLGMANEGADSNGSQFFLTLGSTPELQGRNTMFGRVEGDTIYNLMKMADAELSGVEGSERPLYPTRITGAEVLVNPFEDMVARVRDAPRSKEDAGKKEAKKRKKPATKNTLSFADEEGDGEMAAPIVKKAKANPKLVVVQEDERDTRHPEEKDREHVRPKAPRVEVERNVSNTTASTIKPPTPKNFAEESDENQSPEPDEAAQRRKALEKTNAEIQALKASMKRNVNVAPTETKSKPKSILEAMTPSTSTRGRKRGKLTDEHGALDMFKAFKQRLEGLPPDDDAKNEDEDAAARPNGLGSAAVGAKQNGEVSHDDAGDEEAELCDLHFIANCQSCRSWNEDQPDGNANGDGDDDVGWMAHSLKFAKDTLGKDLEWKKKMEEIEVIDPREKARVIQEERRKDRDRGKGKR